MEYGEAVSVFEEFFTESYYERVAKAIQKGEESIVVEFDDLDAFEFRLTEELRERPEKMLDAAEEGVLAHDQIGSEEFKIRITGMPEEDFVLLKNMRSKHISKFIPVEGMIKRASQVKPEVVSAIWECSNCGDRYEVEQDSSSQLKSPYKCDCGTRKFDLDEKVMTDTQNITVEENPESREGSEQPSTLSIRLEGDLVDPEFQRKVVPGNVAEITGIVREKPLKKKSKKYDIYMDANYLEPTQQEFEQLELEEDEIEEIKELSNDPEIFEKIAASIAPSIFGHEEIKKAIALQMFGGVKKTREDGVKSRGDLHILLIGEPGTGKSQMLKFAGELAPKGRYVVGKSSTGAGLTAAVVRDEATGEFSLEAGAVVLAHKGMAAIDEIDKMSQEDRSSLHEAMEQQQISVSKANIQATLNAQTSILAAGNPKYGRFDPYEPIPEQINIGDTLLSRFDFIFPVTDEPDEEKDKELSSQIMKNHLDPEEITGEISQEMLRKYIAFAKQKRPQLTPEAAEEIQEFYVNMRSKGDDDGEGVPITARQLEALIRVAEASARAGLKDEVEPADSQRAIDILTYCLKQVGVDPETGDFDIDRIETGTSTSERNRLQTVKRIIKEMAGDGEAEIEEVLEEAEDQGIGRDKAEEVINRLKRDGELFEPKQGFIQKI